MPNKYVSELGAVAAREMFGEDGAQRMEAGAQHWEKEVDARWAQIITDFIINGMYARGVLPTSTRELCAVAALAVLGRAVRGGATGTTSRIARRCLPAGV